jgi:Domain of unknown function (DUF4192)
MTTPTAVVRVSSPSALLSVVPQLLGFMPENSLVVIGLAPPRDRIRVTLRYDLPDPPGQGVSEDVAGHAVGVLDGQRLTTMVAVAYGPETLAAPAAAALLDAAEEAGIRVPEFLRVQDARYWSYVCTSEVCCPAAGVPFEVTPDPDLTGGPVLAARAALAASVAAVNGAAAESMRQATRQAEQHTAQLLESADRRPARHMLAVEGLAEVGAMIARYQDGGGFTTDDEIARITLALRDLRVRDDAWARMDPAFTAQDVKLWTDVVQRAQPRYVAAPAALLAFVAWQSGNGALANVALDRALADDPRYSMALLLRQVITAGAPPSLARLPMTPEEVAASYDEADAEAADSEASKLAEES